MKFDDRVFRLLADDLYVNDLAFIRELTANSIDANATTVTIHIEPDQVVVMDDGKGMTEEFLKTDFTRIGKQFKRDGEIGLYGVGRLSVWKVAKNVVVQSGNKQFVWDGMRFEVRDAEDSYVLGTKFTIKTREDKRVRVDVVESFIRDNFYNVKADVKVNGQAVEAFDLSGFSKFGFTKERAVVYIPNDNTTTDLREVKVLERGFMVKTLSLSLPAIVNFNRQIKTLSRENCTVEDDDIRRLVETAYISFLTKADIKICESLKTSIVRALYWREMRGEEGLQCLVYDGEKLGEIMNRYDKGKIVYSTQAKSLLVERANRKGFRVLTVGGQDEARVLERHGFKDIKTVEDLTEIVTHSKANTKEERMMLGCAKTFFERIDRIVRENHEVMVNSVEGVLGERAYSLRVHSGATADQVKNEKGFDEYKTESGFTIAIGETDNPSIIAWRIGNTVAINKTNEFVQMVLETKQFEMLEESLIHEYTHIILNQAVHDNEFVETYNFILIECKKAKLREQKGKDKTEKLEAFLYA